MKIHCVDDVHVEFNSMTLSVGLSGIHPSSLKLCSRNTGEETAEILVTTVHSFRRRVLKVSLDFTDEIIHIRFSKGLGEAQLCEAMQESSCGFQ